MACLLLNVTAILEDVHLIKQAVRANSLISQGLILHRTGISRGDAEQ